MDNKLVKAADFGLTTEKGTMIEQEFAVVSTEQAGLIEIYSSILKKELNKETEEEARVLSNKLSKLNASNNKIHKSQKAFYLAGGKFCDALKNKNRDIIQEMQDRLGEIKNYSKNLRLAEIAKLEDERLLALEKCECEVIPQQLGEMSNDVWEAYITSQQKAFEDKKAAEVEAEKQRLAKIEEDRKEQIRIRKENEALKLEAEKKEKKRLKEEKERQRLAKIEADKQAKIKADYEAKIQAEKDRLAKIEEEKETARLKAENLAKKKQAEYEAKIKAEQDKAAKIEAERIAEIEAQKQAKLVAEQEAEAQMQRELSKGDSAKFKDLNNDLETLKTKYEFKSAKNKKMYTDVSILIDKVIAHINK